MKKALPWTLAILFGFLTWTFGGMYYKLQPENSRLRARVEALEAAASRGQREPVTTRVCAQKLNGVSEWSGAEELEAIKPCFYKALSWESLAQQMRPIMESGAEGPEFEVVTDW